MSLVRHYASAVQLEVLANAFAGALDVNLNDEEMKYLEEPYRPLAISGHI